MHRVDDDLKELGVSIGDRKKIRPLIDDLKAKIWGFEKQQEQKHLTLLLAHESDRGKHCPAFRPMPPRQS